MAGAASCDRSNVQNGLHDRVPGSYSSGPDPGPTTSTVPSSSSVAELSFESNEIMSPVTVHVPLAGSYSSADLEDEALVDRPATSTVPSRSSVAVIPSCGAFMSPVAVQEPVSGSYSSAERSIWG